MYQLIPTLLSSAQQAISLEIELSSALFLTSPTQPPTQNFKNITWFLSSRVRAARNNKYNKKLQLFSNQQSSDRKANWKITFDILMTSAPPLPQYKTTTITIKSQFWSACHRAQSQLAVATIV